MDNPVVAAVSDLGTSLAAARKLVENELWSCSGAEVSGLLGQVHRFEAQLASLKLHLVREVSVRGIPQEVGAVNARAYWSVRWSCRLPRRR